MPSALVLKTMNAVHRTVMIASRGRIGWTAGKMPVLELTTTGRKSGKLRSTMLTSPWQDGESIAIIASAGGNDAHPAWYLNLEADPSVSVRTEDRERPMTARTVTGDERLRLWTEISEVHTNYAGYQKKTDREIPVILLEPTD
ncbi:MAG: nitroreductase family deazaflavin-dependent oxidoreductase [Ilumatobacter sp.]|nr:nitroreductase family deazaflavin-dependent oxidoreductase [Ilumatobacter sp.]